jgi:hypothetical protein
VISVGNLAMGGRGKTPLVAYIASLLLEAGERPAILSRGYGRRRVEDGVVVVSDGVRLLADLDRSGDEPLMLARALPGVMVFVSESRTIAAALAGRVFGATVLVLDDGFQHRAIARDVDIVVVTPADLDDRRAPFGRLRESVSALSRADLKRFPGIGDPGAAKVLLFNGGGTGLALESNGLRVLVRLGHGREAGDYTRTWRAVNAAIEPELRQDPAWRLLAHQLLRRHGQETCKHSRPRCEQCPLAQGCRWATSGGT